MASDIFQAAQTGDIDAVRAFLRSGLDVESKNEFGFTALHCAAMACNKADGSAAMEVIRTLLEHGASPNSLSRDGRSVLYLAAEMSWTLEPVKILIESDGNPDVTDSHGNHIVVNAMASDVKQYLSQLTGFPVPPPPMKLKEAKLSASQWRLVKAQLDIVFDEMNRSGLVAIQDVGYTQDDGFSDCSEQFQLRGGIGAGLTGICFYTRQDLNRAKRTSQLPLAFWGAPDGNSASMVRIGHMILEIFRARGFIVDWRGTAGARPIVCLQSPEPPESAP